MSSQDVPELREAAAAPGMEEASEPDAAVAPARVAPHILRMGPQDEAAVALP